MSSEAEAPRAIQQTKRDHSSLVGPAYLLLSLIALGGLTIGAVPLSVDLANHAARLLIECNPGDQFFSRMYSVEYDLIPNLAIDLLNRPLCGFADPMTVVRGGMITATAGVLLMSWKLHRLFNERPHALVLLAPAMTFNIVTGMGYVNYLIGTFLLLLFAWTLLRFRLTERHPVVAILVPNLFGALIFLCHIFALALAGMFLLGLRFAAAGGQPLAKRILKAGLLTGASFIVPMVMILLSDRSGSGFQYLLAGKVRAFWGPLIYWSILPTAVLAFTWIALLWWVFRERFVIVEPRVRWSLAAMFVFSLALPSILLGATDLDSRCLTSLAFLAVASLKARPDGSGYSAVPRAPQAAAVLIAFVTVAVQIGLAAPKSALLDRQVAELRRAASIIQPLQPVLVLQDDRQAPPMQEHLYFHLASYLTRDRSAFNPSEFTGVGMQPLRAKPEFACIDAPAGEPIFVSTAAQLINPSAAAATAVGQKPYAVRWPERFDYVILYQWGEKSNPFPAILTPVRHGSFFTIFRTPRRSSVSPCA